MKNKKRLWLGMAAAFLSALLVAAACEGKLPMAKADEVTVVAEGVCGYGDEDNGTATITYRLESDGRMTISGSGYMENYGYLQKGYDDEVYYEYNELSWSAYRNSIRELVVEEGVLSVGKEAFRDCKNLEKVSLPESLERIKVRSFQNCTSLTRLEMGSDIQEVRDEAFRGCISLRRVYLPSTDAWWGKYVFADCRSLERVEFAEGFSFKTFWPDQKSIYINGIDSGCSMFYNCRNLKEVILPESIGMLPTGFFWGCASLPKEYALRGSTIWSTCVPDMGVEEFALPSYVRTLTSLGMAGNERVRKLIVPESVETIERMAFAYDEAVEEVVLPRHVVWDTDYAFSGCKRLKEVRLPQSVESLYGTFENCESLEKISIPKGVTYLGDYAFKDCRSLRKISIPKGVTYLGDCAFKDCRSLKEIKIPKGVKELGNQMFSGCKNLKEISLPKGVEHMGYETFSGCTNLEKINLPKGLKQMGDEGKDEGVEEGAIFKDCKSLKEICIPEKLYYIPKQTFMGCRKLKTVYIKSKQIWEVEEDAFKGIHKNACIYVPKGKMKFYKELIKESGAKMKGWTWKYL